MKFSLIIPLWNEGENVVELIRVIADSGLPQAGMAELILVNNGSADQTGALIDAAAGQHPWIVPVHLAQNLNYGGGVYEGFKYARSELLCYIPGDLQVMPDDVLRVYQAFCAHPAPKQALFVKGHRTVRHDPRQTQLVSHVYTFLANRILRLRVKDVNGLPKLFHRALMDLVPAERMRTFVFDSQILALARQHAWTIEEIPVTFHSRRVGVSSWSRKRFQVYLQVLRQVVRLRALRGAPGVPLERRR
jgi:glycosyltransferase involved in cell wall biosynthesis